ncbi:MAG: 50S ribosomal protein L6 [Candidatus Yanofskybacteria bacterium GW2011_GWA2_41_22]|uniref:Large ribosomal subunit protein uL6 n=5 Tax=Parcubacteria group TaxID=1794811 RepID=A0A1F8HU95_9BACT|nr:MAG: 50S ribosomal protein L6 [Candidatus Yanofskybacteria bacterium GW2011_GWA2_41_22]KKS25731.1 MAG: 50S ribosomal protein L6 [Candidatus Jorgensenbacteria bacterium GW2011_GWF2_41_8]KKS27574.1 MAG: 50S ribosomal protein L6 [Candidatus Yanofskybacteria bacterium GW2011_GWC2_41_9]OGM99873.1 MAG: 50S ribosomal protein L6 [Candidatus Yanofskybacteria bacterium RIFCSPHIGHO2_01_FULL_41_27]OGN08842.1 MAG: 50S ribosomal protein L6 [Candidatus Yanofskybacteria bacterium RIFCSPHIGHO2_02_FULL_41_12]
MSKIGKKIINVPAGVEIRIEDGVIFVKGPKGELKRTISGALDVNMENNIIKIQLRENVGKDSSALWGLTRALIANMIKGVTEGFETILEFQGVGYKAAVKGNELELNLGYSHPITITAPEGVSFKVEKNVIKVSGFNKELVGEVAADIRTKRKPEPYKGSGIKYNDEVIIKKAGKKSVATS